MWAILPDTILFQKTREVTFNLTISFLHLGLCLFFFFFFFFKSKIFYIENILKFHNLSFMLKEHKYKNLVDRISNSRALIMIAQLKWIINT